MFHTLTSVWTTLTKRTSISDWTETWRLWENIAGSNRSNHDVFCDTDTCFKHFVAAHFKACLWCPRDWERNTRHQASRKLVKLRNLLRFCYQKVFFTDGINVARPNETNWVGLQSLSFNYYYTHILINERAIPTVCLCCWHRILCLDSVVSVTNKLGSQVSVSPNISQ